MKINKKIIKKEKMLLISVMLTTVLIMGGCGSGSGRGVTVSKDFVYRCEELPVMTEMPEINSLLKAGDTVYVYGNIWEESSNKLVIAQLDDAGAAVQKIEINIDGTEYGALGGDEDGNLYVAKRVYNPSGDSGSGDFGSGDPVVLPEMLRGEIIIDDAVDGNGEDSSPDADADADTDTAAGENTGAEENVGAEENTDADSEDPETVDEDAETINFEELPAETAAAINPEGDFSEEVTTEQLYLVRLNMDGSENWSVCLNDIAELNNQDYMYVNSIIGLPGGRVLVSVGSNYAIFDNTGNYQGLLKLSGPGADTVMDNINSLIPMSDGRAMITSYSDMGMNLQELNLGTGVLGEAIDIGSSGYSNTYHPGGNYDLYISDYSDVYGYNIGQEPVKLMNYVDSDLNISGLSNIIEKTPDVLWGIVYDNMEGRNYLASFTKVPPEEVVDKVWITMASLYTNWEVKNQIIQFNKSSEKYRIQINEYVDVYSGDADAYTAGMERLNADIASGRVPDLLVLTSDMPIKSYMNKGLFADLKPFVEADEELDMADLAPNVVEAFSLDGKWYQMVPDFMIATVYAKTAVVGSEPGWTLAEATALMAERPEGTELFQYMLRDDFIRNSLALGGDQFVDWEAGKCEFDSENFIRLLEFAKTLPTEIDYESVTGGRGIYDYSEPYRDESVIAMLNDIYDFRSINTMEQITFGGEITPIGFPTEEGIGASIRPSFALAMSARSKNQEAVWEFMRYYLTDEYQMKEEYSYALPISLKAMDVRAEQATKRPFYLDEDGNKVEYDDTYYLNDQEIIVKPSTAEDVAVLKDYILSINTICETDQALLDIITEEAASYFEDQKRIAEVVEIIQSRAQLYISENS